MRTPREVTVASGVRGSDGMTERERLIEIIGDLPFTDEYMSYNSWEWAEHFADHLLSNGVVCPPCKVGDRVYVDEKTWFYNSFLYYENRFIHSKYFVVGEIVSIIKTKKQLLIKIRVSNSIHSRYRHKRYPVSALGKTVFLTKEEAETKLKERSDKNDR